MSNGRVTANDLPLDFQVKYLGACKAQGSWGLDFIRKPVDLLVDSTKTNRSTLPTVEIIVTTSGIELHELSGNVNSSRTGKNMAFKIETISYGVQDLTFTRIFAMIITNPSAVKQGGDEFSCHAFACPSKLVARQLTYALAAAFKFFADRVKSKQEEEKLKRTIDLRHTKDEKEDDDDDSETEA